MSASGTIVLRFLIGFIPVVALTAVMWPHIPRRYEASAVVVLRPSDTGSAGDANSLRQILDESAIQSEIDHITSARLADAVIREHKLLADPEFASHRGRAREVAITLGLLSPSAVTVSEVRQSLGERLSISRDRRSYTVTMGYWSADPAKAADMTRTLLKAYVADQVHRKRSEITKVASLMQLEADARGAAYNTSKENVEKLLAETGLLDTGEQVAIDSQLSTLSNEAAQARARTIEATIRVNTLRELKEAGNLAHAPGILNSPTVQRLKENLAAAISKSAVLGSETRTINAEIATEAERVVGAAEVELAEWRQREVMLSNEIAKLRKRLTERRRNELRLEELKAQAALDKEAYDKAVLRMQTQLARVDGLLPDIDIITNADTPLRPAFPHPLLTTAASLMLAVTVGILMAWRPLLRIIRRPGEAPSATGVRDGTETSDLGPTPLEMSTTHAAAVHHDANIGRVRRI